MLVVRVKPEQDQPTAAFDDGPAGTGIMGALVLVLDPPDCVNKRPADQCLQAPENDNRKDDRKNGVVPCVEKVLLEPSDCAHLLGRRGHCISHDQFLPLSLIRSFNMFIAKPME